MLLFSLKNKQTIFLHRQVMSCGTKMFKEAPLDDERIDFSIKVIFN